MRKKAGIILITMMLVAGLVSCGTEEKDAKDPSTETEQPGTPLESQPGDEKEEASGNGKETAPGNQAENPGEGDREKEPAASGASHDNGMDNFDADMEEVAAYAAAIKEAVAAKDMEKLADLTGFPVYVGLDDAGVVETREAFLALDPQEVFSEGMVTAIEKADISALAPSRAGFTLLEPEVIGGPGITFGLVEGEYRITGINY